MPRKGKKGAAVTKSRYIPKMFLRGDSVIYVLKNPKWSLKTVSKMLFYILLSIGVIVYFYFIIGWKIYGQFRANIF